MQNLPKSLLGFYIKYAAKPFAGILVGWFLLYMTVRLTDGTLFPLIQKWFIALFEQPIVPGTTLLTFAVPIVSFFFLIFILIDSAAVGQDILFARWQPKIRHHLSQRLNDYVHGQSMSFYTGRIAGKINSQIEYIAGGFGLVTDFSSMLGSVLVILLNMGLVFRINTGVAVLLGCAFLFRIVYSIWRMKPMNKASKTASESSSSLSGKVIDSISNFSIVKLFTGAVTEKTYLEKARCIAIKDRIHAGFMQRIFWIVPTFVWDILFCATMLLCAQLYLDGQMKVSDIVFTISVYFSVMGAVSNLTQRIPNLVDVIGSAQQSYKELIKPIEIQDAPNAPDLNMRNGGIEIRNVTFKYGKKKILDDLSLSIKPGEKVGLVGPSGAGKTTLVNLLMRFYDPVRGAIYFDGQDIKTVTQNSLRAAITFIPQEPALFNRTLLENVSYGKPDADFKEVRAAAKKAAADEFIMATDKKYDSMVGDRGIKLSGGQKQRVAIARAFLKNAPVLILDEATSALDSETESVIQKSFEELSRGRTTIVIAHRLSTLRHMDRIVVIDQGKIVESGPHNTLIKKKGGIYAKLWQMQTSGFLQEDTAADKK